MDELPNIFWTPRERGSLVDLRIRAHEGGGGERVAQMLTLSQAQAIVKAVENHDDLLDKLSAIVACYGVGYRDPAKFVEAVHDLMEEGRIAVANAEGVK